MTRKRWPTALVTGASSGIGEAIARRLAAAGTHVVLVSDEPDRLEAVAGDLPTETEVLAADLTHAPHLAAVEERVAEVDLLVNSAGIGTQGPFGTGPFEAQERLIDLNVRAVVRLAHAAAGPMVERRSGTIVNLSSCAAWYPGRENATYNASKVFVRNFSEALHEELRPSGVTVTAVCPGLTRTEFQERAGMEDARLPRPYWQEPDEVADEALAAAAKGRALVVTGRANRITAGALHVLPRRGMRRLATFNRRG